MPDNTPGWTTESTNLGMVQVWLGVVSRVAGGTGRIDTSQRRFHTPLCAGRWHIGPAFGDTGLALPTEDRQTSGGRFRSRASSTRGHHLPGDFREAGCSGSIHTLHLTSGAEVGHDLDRSQVSASVVKVPITLEFYAQADAGMIDPSLPIVIDSSNRTFGPTGVSRFLDPATISLRDLAYLMLTISDNAATDLVKSVVGLEAINRRLADVGSVSMTPPSLTSGRCSSGRSRSISASATTPSCWPLRAETSVLRREARSTNQAGIDRCRALDPAQSNRTTARDSTRAARRRVG